MLLAIISTIATASFMVAGYELYMSYRYDQWHAQYERSDEWIKGLPVKSLDEVLMWEYRSNGEYTHPSYGTVTKTNEFGFRQAAGNRVSRPDNTRRIAFVGDSVTLGREVSFEQTFPEIVKAIAGQSALPYRTEALNFAIDGYSTPQISRNLTKSVLRFSPNVIVYTMCLNDFDFDDASGEKVRYFKRPKSFAYDTLRGVLKRTVAADYHTYHFRQNRDIVFREIALMQHQAKERGLDFYVFIVPSFTGDYINLVGSVRVFKFGTFDAYPLADLHKQIVGTLNEMGIRVFDTLPRFIASRRPPSDFAFDVWHLNASGHELVGHAIADIVLKEWAHR